MNRMKWQDPSIPLSVLVAKLAEETGEVSREITDAYMKGDNGKLATANTIEECEHVQFIAQCIIDRIHTFDLTVEL